MTLPVNLYCKQKEREIIGCVVMQRLRINQWKGIDYSRYFYINDRGIFVVKVAQLVY